MIRPRFNGDPEMTSEESGAELIAELGSAFLAGHLGITVEPRADHAAYLASWLRVLRNDARAVVTAAARAQQAVDFLIAAAGCDADQESPVGTVDGRCSMAA